MKNYRNLSSVIRQVVTEAHTKDHLPFTPDKKPSFKKPAGQGDAAGIARARALAREAMQQKMKESFDLDISEEEADDLLNSIQESRWVDEYDFTSADHEDAAAKHERTAAGHLKDAQEHQRAGRKLEFHASMRGHYDSLRAHHDSMERSHLVAAKPLFRGTGPRND